jgi:cell division protein FtsN
LKERVTHTHGEPQVLRIKTLIIVSVLLLLITTLRFVIVQKMQFLHFNVTQKMNNYIHHDNWAQRVEMMSENYNSTISCSDLKKIMLFIC